MIRLEFNFSIGDSKKSLVMNDSTLSNLILSLLSRLLSRKYLNSITPYSLKIKNISMDEVIIENTYKDGFYTDKKSIRSEEW